LHQVPATVNVGVDDFSPGSILSLGGEFGLDGGDVHTSRSIKLK